ncbi:hypothetical protein Tco_1551889 [Tanacetum coccineum]
MGIHYAKPYTFAVGLRRNLSKGQTHVLHLYQGLPAKIEIVICTIKYSAGSFVGKALTWLNFEIRTRGREAAIETELWNHAMVGARHAAYTDRYERKDNKRTRMGNAFAMTVNPVRGGYTGMAPKCTACGYHHLPETPCRSCFNYNRPCHFARDCRVTPRNVNPINARNPVARTYFECGSTDHIKSACPRINQAQRLGGNQ